MVSYKIIVIKVKLFLKGDTALYALSNIIFLGTIFCADIYIARLFSINNVSYWKQVILLIQVTIPFFSLGIIEGFKYAIAREEPKISEFLGSVIAGITTIGLIMLLFFSSRVIVSRISEWVGLKSITEIAIWIPLLFLVLAFINVFQYVAIVKNRVFVILSSNLIFAFTFFITLYLLLHVRNINFVTKILYTFLISYTLQLTYYIYEIRPELSFSTIYVNSKNYLKYGFPLFIASYIGVITLNIDKIIVNKLGGTTQFAIYTVGALEIPVIALLVKSITTISYPKIVKNVAENNLEAARKIWFDNLIQISYISFPIIILFMFFSKNIIVGIYGPRYLTAVPIFKAYCLILLWRNSVYGTLLSVRGKTLIITIYSAIAFISNIALCYLFYDYFGTVGVIYATFISITILHFLIIATEGLFLRYFKLFIKYPIYTIMYLLVILTYFMG